MKKRHLEEFATHIIEELRYQSPKQLVMMYSVFLSLDSGEGKLLKGEILLTGSLHAKQ